MMADSKYPESFELGNGSFAMLSPAKINLALRVLGKRPDGYHELHTVFQEIDLCDRLEFHPSHDWSLEIAGSDLDPGETNLITRAARRLAGDASHPLRARVVLHKNIPSGGGLGGGSSNAAVTLMGLNRLWQLGYDESRLSTLAAHLGSDCTFFLHGGLAIGRGRGEVIELVDDTISTEIVLVIPPFGVSTAEVYSWGEFPLTHDEKSVILESSSKDFRGFPEGSESFNNDLESLVLGRFQELHLLKKQLLDLGADVAMLSGSGSCIFAIFPDHSRALRAAQHFREPYRAVISHTVSRPRSR
jgi:4-diphosphocytidyl-2-C-methyl-D-erythritol kinase